MKKEKSVQRKELEADVVAFNKTLKPVVGAMDIIFLLRNCHPMYRTNHARNLKAIGEITENQMKEFTGGKVVFENFE